MADEISFPPFAPVGGGLGSRAIRNLVIDARAGPSARAMERFLKPTMPFRATRISLLCSGHLFDSLVSAVPPYRWGPGEGGVRSERRGMAVSRFSTCETKLMA